MQTILPASDFILAKIPLKESTSKSGLIIPPSAQETNKVAEIINVGEEVNNHKRGDLIVYKSYSVTEVKLNDEDFIIIKQEDVLGTVLEVKEKK